MNDTQPVSVSYLLRFWEEPRRNDGQAPVLRCYLRNLKTGQEIYVGDPSTLGGQLLAQLQRQPDAAPSAQTADSVPPTA